MQGKWAKFGAGQRCGGPLRKAGWIAAAAMACLFSGTAALAAEFASPTPAELAMTSLPGYPGAAAVVLYREDITRDSLRSIQRYERIKVLTEEGKRYANVDLSFVSLTETYWSAGDQLNVEDIVGRTIQPNGKVIPFTGKPYMKVLVKANGVQVREKVFTLPDVQVGSILEYRYAVHYDNYYEAPTWMIQGDLFVKEGHFAWYPTTHYLIDDEGRSINTITYFPVLPQGAKMEYRDLPGSSSIQGAGQVYELKVKDVPPKVKGDYMPPIESFSYRVEFAFSPFRTGAEFWREEGKSWSKRVNRFTDPNHDLQQATQKVIEGAATPEEKVHKIYAAVEALENTEYTRSRDQREDKAAGVGEIHNVADVLTHERGTPNQLTELFIGMCRAAGMPAYAMLVPSREERIFVPALLSMRQFDALIAVVAVDGKERYFDPGSRYASFGQLAWQHTMVQGLRQTAEGTALAPTPGESYKSNRTTRVANLTMNEHGEVTGKIDLTFSGAPAMHWRQTALRGDEESLRHGLSNTLEHMVPKTLEIEVSEIKGLKEYDSPLAVSYKVKGSMGAVTGKRVLLPTDIFLADGEATFPHEKRELAVYFSYPQYVQDAIRVNFPATYTVEAVPSSSKFKFADGAAYALNVTAGTNNITTRREFLRNSVIVLVPEYGALRTFYSQFESKDQENTVLKVAPATTASN